MPCLYYHSTKGVERNHQKKKKKKSHVSCENGVLRQTIYISYSFGVSVVSSCGSLPAVSSAAILLEGGVVQLVVSAVSMGTADHLHHFLLQL